MKKVLITMFLIVGFINAIELKKISFEEYLSNFDYVERGRMKIKTPEMLALVENGEAVLVDIRFPEEYAIWHVKGAINIPINELPKRFHELPKDKLIITACPHYDRSSMARIFLSLQGFNAKYLSDGLLKTVDFLRGDNAKEYFDALQMKEKK